MNIYEKTIAELETNADAKYKEFNDKIIVSAYKTVGVRIPVIKQIAKSIPQNEINDYLENCKFENYECTLIYGLLIARLGFDEMWSKKDFYLSKCDGWGLVDSFVPAIKVGAKDRKRFYLLLTDGIEKQENSALRFRIVALMNFFVGGEHTEEILRITERLDGKGYYNDMAIAWLISTAFVKQRESTLKFLENDKLGKFTHNKAISKINDSLRVSVEDKTYLKTLRKL